MLLKWSTININVSLVTETKMVSTKNSRSWNIVTSSRRLNSNLNRLRELGHKQKKLCYRHSLSDWKRGKSQ
jgi:hypothetical protein